MERNLPVSVHKDICICVGYEAPCNLEILSLEEKEGTESYAL